MHLYSYDDWVSGVYSTTEQNMLLDTQTSVVALSGQNNPAGLRISVSSIADSYIDIGCLYQYKSDSGYLNKQGCIQSLNDETGDVSNFPYILKSGYLTQENNQKIIHNYIEINLSHVYQLEKVLIFIEPSESYQDNSSMNSNLQFGFINSLHQFEFSRSICKININQQDPTSNMLAAALISFSTRLIDNSVQGHIIIKNLSKFVYGRVDMSNQYNWNVLWKTINK